MQLRDPDQHKGTLPPSPEVLVPLPAPSNLPYCLLAQDLPQEPESPPTTTPSGCRNPHSIRTWTRLGAKLAQGAFTCFRHFSWDMKLQTVE